MDHICEFCDKNFSSKYALKVHKENAKYCLASRNKKPIKGYKCDYCNHTFNYKSALKRHVNNCLMYKDFTIDEQNKQIIELTKKVCESKKLRDKIKDQEKVIQELKSVVEEKDQKILELEKLLAHQKGIVVGVGKPRPPKIINANNYVNQKLAMISIKNIQPLTVNFVKNQIDNYTYDMYLRKDLGIIQFIENLTILTMDDGTIEKNYACTDRSRNAFHRLTSAKEWKTDGGANFINRILDTISPQVKIHSDTLNEEIEKRGGPSPKTEYIMRMVDDLLPFYIGVTQNESKERVKVFEKIRKAIKDTCSLEG